MAKRVDTAAEKLQITDYLHRRPRNLSGGQRQRVAIGRAIVRDPEVFLFDKPLSNLDAALRVQTRVEIARLHDDLASTMIYVTHDQVETMTLADKIVVLRDASIAGGAIAPIGRADASGKIRLGVRSEHMRQATAADAYLAPRLQLVEQLGEYVLVHMKTDGGVELTAKLPHAPNVATGEPLPLTFAPEAVHLLDATTGARF